MIIDEMDPVDVFLQHHGVKGMHWGVRKERVHRVMAGTDTRKRKVKKALALGVGAASIAAASAFIATRGMVPVSQLHASQDQLKRVRHLIQRAAHQNVVRQNAANDIRRFVQTL